MVRALKHFKCYLYGQKITVRTDNSAVSWLHRSKDPVEQPGRWIEVIDTYDITFQHRPGRKHGNADALSRYPCRQCVGDCEGIPAKEVRAVTRSQKCEPGWTPEEMAAGPVPEGGAPGDEARVGQARATHPDELPGYASGQHGGDLQHDDAGPAHTTSRSGHVRGAPGAGRGRKDSERVRGHTPGGAAGGVPTRPRGPATIGRCIKNMNTTVKFRGENTKPESWYGFTT